MEQVAYTKRDGTVFYVGQQINAFIIKAPACHVPEKDPRRTYLLCECTRCGSLSYIRSDSLTNNHSNGCGQCSRGTPKITPCNWKYKTNTDIANLNTNNIKNSLLNRIFGKMKVLDLHSRDKFGHVFYNCQCLECNNTEIVRADKLVEKSILTCSNCSNAKSLGQQKVEQWLKENNINYNTEYSFNDLIGTSGKLRFDICVFVNNRPVLIEIQGRQHYEPVEFFGGIEQFKLQQYYDNLKREYCKRNNYVLIEIPYTDFDNLEQYLLFLSF